MSSAQSLGQYFRRLRQERKPWPDLDRETLERMTREEIRAELKKRRWGVPRWDRLGRASDQAMVKHFLERQAAQGTVTMGTVATRCGLDRTVIWKIEHDRAVQIDSLRAALHDGLGLASDSDHVHHALALWTVASGRGATKAEAPAKTSRRARVIGAVQTSASVERFLKRAATVLAQIPESDHDDVLAALSNPAVVATLRSLNQVAAAKNEPKRRVVDGGRGRKKTS